MSFSKVNGCREGLPVLAKATPPAHRQKSATHQAHDNVGRRKNRFVEISTGRDMSVGPSLGFNIQVFTVLMTIGSSIISDV